MDVMHLVTLTLNWIFGPAHPALTALLVLMGLDLLTRSLAQQIRPGRKKGQFRKDLLKKGLLGCLLVAVHQLDHALGQQDTLRNGVAYALLGHELLSITEHMAQAGVPIPGQVVRIIQALRNSQQPENLEAGTEKTRTSG